MDYFHFHVAAKCALKVFRNEMNEKVTLVIGIQKSGPI